MKALAVLFSLSLLIGCAPLHPHSSAWGDAGEVAGRVLLCPLTLCTSELILQKEHEADEQRFAYARWYNSLSPEQRNHEDARSAAAAQALGLALSGGGPRFTAPAPYQAPRPALNCTSYMIGDRAYVNCP